MRKHITRQSPLIFLFLVISMIGTIFSSVTPAVSLFSRHIARRVQQFSDYRTTAAGEKNFAVELPNAPGSTRFARVARVTLGGRVTDARGQGIGGLEVELYDSEDHRKIVITDSSGGFVFNNVPGRWATVVVKSDRYKFEIAARLIGFRRNAADLNFTGQKIEKSAPVRAAKFPRGFNLLRENKKEF